MYIIESYEQFLYEKKYTPSERKDLESKGMAMKGGRFPIVDAGDVRNAIWYLPKIKDVKDVAIYIVKRMKELDVFDKYKDMLDKTLKLSHVKLSEVV